MMIFKKVRYKNFLSTGNAFTEVHLNRSQTTLLTAKNGGGKSTVIDAIVFALYGTPFRKINKPALINSINKRDMLVEIDFSIGNVEYMIRRGVKPNIFEVYKNGAMVNQAADVREYQQHLELNILKMNKSSFCQIVVLGSATYIPFMVLTPYQRREIIEDLLDIGVFSKMNTLLKQKVTANKDATQEAKYNIDLVNERIAMQTQLLKRLSQDHASKVKAVEDRLQNAQSNYAAATVEAEELRTQYDFMMSGITDRAKNKDTINQINLLRDKLHDKVSGVDKQISFFHNADTCPTCTQAITAEFKQTAIAEREGNKAEIQRALPSLEQKYSDLLARFTEIESTLKQADQLRRSIDALNAAIKVEQRLINDLERDLLKARADNSSESVDKGKMRQLVDEKTAAEANLEALLRQTTVLGAASSLLKDGGIKSKIIKQYIPIMNKLINKYLAAMDFFVQFELDENFNETIKSRFRDDFGYQNFSEGEKLRIDLAILFAWRTVAKMRNSASTNLLIMDEILDGALDANGIDEFLGIIQELNKDSNVFVISHRGDQLFDKFHSVIKFEKQGNFSRIV